jgi:hypothetical protein
MSAEGFLGGSVRHGGNLQSADDRFESDWSQGKAAGHTLASEGAAAFATNK